MRVLAIVAHPDDEVLGMGGTLARHAAQGDEVGVVVVSEGRSSREPTASPAGQPPPAVRNELTSATATMSARLVAWLGLPDNQLDTVPLLGLINALQPSLNEVQPEIVYTHFHGDGNVDHQLVCRAVLTATRPGTGSPVRRVLAAETPSSTGWLFATAASFTPNVHVNITAQLETKLAAMEAYASELHDFPHPRSLDALRALAQWRGSEVGVEAAEAFLLLRAVWR